MPILLIAPSGSLHEWGYGGLEARMTVDAGLTASAKARLSTEALRAKWKAELRLHAFDAPAIAYRRKRTC